MQQVDYCDISNSNSKLSALGCDTCARFYVHDVTLCFNFTPRRANIFGAILESAVRPCVVFPAPLGLTLSQTTNFRLFQTQ